MFVRRENLGLLLAFLGGVLFGGTLPATRLAVQSLDPWFVTFARGCTRTKWWKIPNPAYSRKVQRSELSERQA
jgi:hypothetical protein